MSLTYLIASIRFSRVHFTDPEMLVGAIFHSRISDLVPNKISTAALKAGLPKSSLPALITDLVNKDAKALPEIPGVTPEIIAEAVVALKDAYLHSFRSVWIAACCFSAVGLFCKYPLS